MAASSSGESSSTYVCLSNHPLRFDPVSRENSVFFDEANKQVFSVRQIGGFTRVVVKGPDNQRVSRFDIPDKGHVASIKFSLDQKILAVQRTAKAVDFLNFFQGSDTKEYQQSCKSKAAQIIGFNWTGSNEIVFNTSQGLELYQVLPEKNTLKLIKHYSVQVNWFVYLADISLLLFSSTALGNVIHPYYIKAGSVTRLPKFEVELPPVTQQKPKPSPLLERDVSIACLYGDVYVIVLRTQSRGSKLRGEKTTGAEVVLYQLLNDRPARRSYVLQLNTSGRFAVNTVDNLVLVHHQASKTSMIFDIKLKGQSDGQVTYLSPVLAPLSIQSCTIEEVPGSPEKRKTVNCELYSANWIVFQPNIIIDAKLGCLWGIYVQLDPLLNMIADKTMLIDFLLMRRNSKSTILKVCRQALMPGCPCPLTMIAAIFDKLNKVYQVSLGSESSSPQSDQGRTTSPLPKSSRRHIGVIDQEDMYREVFSPVIAEKNVSPKFMVSVLIEYIRSLNELQIVVQHCIHELLINILVQNKRYYQLHQLLQYHVINDSKPLACLMLSIEHNYPPAYQLALDMLKRLNTANEQIVETLLSKGQLLPALRFLRTITSEDSVSPRKFLEAAINTGDFTLFYTVFKFFEQRNQKLRGNPMFVPGEHCEQFVEIFEAKFGDGVHKVPVKT